MKRVINTTLGQTEHKWKCLKHIFVSSTINISESCLQYETNFDMSHLYKTAQDIAEL